MTKRIAALTLLTVAVAAAQAQNVYYEGRNLDFENRPYTSRGTIMVPARETGDKIGAPLQRDDRGTRIWWQWRDARATYYKGDRSFDLNGRRVTLSNSSEDRRDVLYVPIEIFRSLTNGRLSSARDDAWERSGQGIPPGRRRDDDWNRGGNGRWDDRNGRWDDSGRYDGGSYGRDSIVFDRREIRFDGDQRPFRKNGVLMVPFRQMGEAIGARTDRTADGLRTWIYFDNNRVEYDKGKTWYRINGDRREVSAISEDRYNILFVPITLFEAVTRGRVRGY